MGYKISDKLSQNWRYRASKDEISNVQTDASLLIKVNKSHGLKIQVNV